VQYPTSARFDVHELRRNGIRLCDGENSAPRKAFDGRISGAEGAFEACPLFGMGALGDGDFPKHCFKAAVPDETNLTSSRQMTSVTSSWMSISRRTRNYFPPRRVTGTQ
jgi:hypothetical protein